MPDHPSRNEYEALSDKLDSLQLTINGLMAATQSNTKSLATISTTLVGDIEPGTAEKSHTFRLGALERAVQESNQIRSKRDGWFVAGISTLFGILAVMAVPKVINALAHNDGPANQKTNSPP